MKGRSILLKLADKGISIKHQSGKLQFFGDLSALTAADKSEIIAAKQDIINYLIGHAATGNVIEKRGEQDNPLSFAQQRLWFIDSLQGSSVEYNMPIAFEVEGVLDTALVTRVFNTIFERHEILTTVYSELDGKAQQRVRSLADCDFEIQQTDLTHLTGETLAQQVKLLVETDSKKPFDLTADLMLRVSYVKTTLASGVLIFNMHHIASDGWSMEILTKEFFALYQAYHQGNDNPLPPLTIQYGDYAHWQCNKLSAQALTAQLDYWQQQLAELPVVHGLTLDHPRPTVKHYQGAKVTASLPATVAKPLLAIAKKYQLTPFMLLHSALALLLSRHSNTHDIVIGTPVANRLEAQLEPLIGFFVNTLVLRADTNHDTLADYFDHIRQVHQQAQSNQDVPFEQLVERLKAPRNKALSPLFQIIMTTKTDYDIDSANDLELIELADIKCRPYQSDVVQAKFDLEVDLSISDKGVGIEWVYDLNLFSEQHIAQLNDHFCRLLGALSQAALDSSCVPHRLPLLSDTETEYLQQLSHANPSYPIDQCIHELFEQQVLAHPNSVAVVCDNRQLSYQQLNEKANQLAHFLKAQHNIKADSLVGICVERSLEMVIGILAILKAGGAYVPLDPSYPKSRLSYLQQDAAFEVVLSQWSLQQAHGAFDCTIVVLDELADSEKHFCSAYSKSNLSRDLSAVTATNLAYVIYTSGSTGQPKGVLTEHLSVVRLVSDPDFMVLNQQTVMMQCANIAFDAATLELWGPLLNGGQCVLYPQPHVSPSVLNQVIEQRQVNALWLTAGLFREWSYYVPEQSPLQYLLAGGDVLDLEAIKRVQQALPELILINGYGPTENTTFSTTYRFEQPHQLTTAPIGKKLSCDQAYVLGSAGQLAPYGSVGELYVGGDGLARGYLNRPELTAKCFISNPFYDFNVTTSAKRLYRTGDLVRYLPDGNLAFIGRADQQVKIRGFRIELGEVQAQLADLETVDSAVVMTQQIAGSQQLVGYVKPNRVLNEQEQGAYIAAVVAQLKVQLPAYMVPTVIMPIAQWPLTPNGKLDKRALPLPDGTTQQGEYIAAETATEQLLVQIWAELLHLDADSISVTANFFELGGHSLLCIRLVSEIRARCEVEIGIQSVFDNDSLQALAREIERNNQQSTRPPLQRIERHGDKVAVSFAQQRLWFIDSLQGGSTEYNLPIAFTTKGQLDLVLLTKVFNTILERHEILRTVYLEENGDTVQHIRPMSEIEFAIKQADLSHLFGDMLATKIKMLVDADIATAFDLSRDLMLRVGYLKTSVDSGVLLFNMHHIASDGWSMEVLTKEFLTLYDAYSQRQPDPLPALTVQYADYSHWQREYLANDVLATQLDYWQQQLDEMPTVHSLPLDHRRPAIKQHNGALVKGELSSLVAKRLMVQAQTHKLTPFMLLHGALSLLLSRHSNSHDIVIGTPVANRLAAELEPLIGFFVNTLVLRVNTHQPTLADYFAHVRQVHLEAQANQDVPFEQLVERLNVPRSTAHSPLFQIMMTTSTDFGLNRDGDIFSLPGVDIQPYESDLVTVKFDLNVNINISEQGVGLEWAYDTGLFSHWHITQLNDHLCRMLEGLSQVETTQALVMLSDGEKQQLLYGLNDTRIDYPKDKCIHQLFEQQARIHPDNVAVVFEGKQLSYRQLNEKANQLARYLRENHPITTDSLVGLCVERSLEMVIAIIAILKSGGAYVPLDPSYPQQRLRYMLKDAELSVVLSQADVHGVLAGYKGTIVALDGFGTSDQHFCSQYGNTDLTTAETGLTSANLAYVIYTSGSTGQPKGVMVEHQALFNRIHWMHNRYGMSADDKVLQKTPFSFDVSVWEFVWTLAYGGQLVVAWPQGHKDPEYLCQLIQDQQVTKLHFVPSMLGVILECEGFNQCHSIKQVFCSGEALQQSHVLGFRQALPAAQLHNLYGPTEAAIDVSYWDCAGDISQGVPIGKPIDNIQLIILDSDLNLVPQGGVGELHIGGDGLARGYFNRYQMTLERFIDNPYYDPKKANSSKRLYKTGDLARWRNDGEIEYQGRTDHQVKIRGLRIELGEIEHQLGGLAVVDSALVLAKEVAGSTQLVGYVKPSKAIVADQVTAYVTDIKAALHNNLPDHMVPSILMVVEQWPLTPNGKVDRKALPQVDDSVLQGEYVAPRSKTEQLLVASWAALLNREPATISTTANFFALGGHSLMGLKLVTRLRSHGLGLTINDLLIHRDLADLAKKVTQAQAIVGSQSAIAVGCDYITPDMLDLVELSQRELDVLMAEVSGGGANIQDIYPLSPLQQGIFYQSLMNRDIDHYITYQTFAIEGEQTYQNFIDGLEYLLTQHDILRTSFHWQKLSEPLQVVHRQVEMPIQRLADAEDAETVVKQRLAQRTFKFNIQQAPLLNLTVCRQSGSDNYAVGIEFHHLVDDAIAIGIFVSQLAQVMSGQTVIVPSEKQYRNYIQRVLNTPLAEAQGFFQRALSPITEMSYIFDIKEQNEIVSGSADVEPQTLSRLKAIASQYQVGLPSLMHLAWSMVVALTSGKKNVVFGSVLSGRMGNSAGLEDMVGPLINTLPLVVNLDSPSFAHLCQSVEASLKDLVKYEYMPLSEAKDCCDFHVAGEMFNAIVNYRYTSDEQTNIGQIQGKDAEELMHYPFALSVDDSHAAMSLTVFAPAPIGTDRMLGYVMSALNTIISLAEGEQQSSVLGSLTGVLPAQEKQQLLYDLNTSTFDYTMDYANDICIHELFEQQVARYPQNIAVALDDQSLTYQQLNDQANRLAHYLRHEQNIQPQQLVGICVERSLAMVVGIMAILKAGAAYVPIEPSYPSERIQYILDDADLSLVLVHQAVLAYVEFGQRTLLNLDDTQLENYSGDNLARPATDFDASALAYVIYTSGSTGRPKGVLIEHQALVYSTVCRFHTYDNFSSFLLLSSMSFDSSIAGIFSSLCSGAKLCLPNEQDIGQLSYLIAQLQNQQVSHFLTVPSFYDVILNALDSDSLPDLRGVIVAGESCAESVVAKHYELFAEQNVQLFNEYGPTEATVWATVAKLKPHSKVTIGKAIPNKHLYIINNDHLAPYGAVGELYIGGEGLARGYHNRADLSAERFIDNPFYQATQAHSSTRLYRTGDLVRYLADGNLEFLGRTDDQVKIRGFRIELGEVEAKLAQFQGIESALVVAKALGATQQLIGYIKPEPQHADMDKSEFSAAARMFLAEQLPEYMIPSIILVVQQWPLTPNGKIDRKALPTPDTSLLQGEYVAAKTQTEHDLIDIWSQLLNFEASAISSSANFFELGGNSLLSIRLMSQIDLQFGVNIDLERAFQMNTCADLAAYIDELLVQQKVQLDDSYELQSDELELTI